MKIVAISDLHGYLPKDIPECDVVCICGDICPLDIQNDTIKCVSWFCLDFNPWANSLPCKKVVFVAGNHDFFLENISNLGTKSPSETMKRLLVGSHKGESKLVYLCDNSVEIEGKRFYGTPWIKDLANWAFYKNDKDIVEAYSRIPKKIDVLLTHMPSILNDTGMVLQHTPYNYLANYGSEELANAINEREIKYALCGHVHSGRHIPENCNGTNVVNVSIKDENYKVNYEPFIFEI